MNKIVKINGLDCPNCAATLEREINKLDGINNAKIDFLKGTIYFESDQIDKALKNIIKLTKQIEPEAAIFTDENNKNNILFDIVILLLGIVMAACTIFIKSSPVIFWILFIISALLIGYKTYYKALRLLIKGIINENLLLTISVIGAAILGEYLESLMVIALYSIGKIFESLALAKSKKSIEKLTNLKVEFVCVLSDEKEIFLQPNEVKTGDIIVVKAGERVAIDGIVIKGSATLDVQSLTGESLPLSIKENERVLSGSIVLDGVLYVKTECEYINSTASKIMELISVAGERKSKTETLISKITRWYTLGVIILSILVFLLVWMITTNFDTAIYRGLIFLVVSCPCAFAISVPLTYFSGIGNASRNGILIKGSNYLDVCSKLSLVAFDKTGTLTTGKFSIEKIETTNGLSEEEIIYYASLGEQNSLHPIATSILEFNKNKLVEVETVKEIAGEGIYYSFNGDNYFVGRKSRTNEERQTVVEVYRNEKKLGRILLSDTIKENAYSLYESLYTLKVETMLLSGDNLESVKSVAKQLHIEQFYSNLLPVDKYKLIEEKKKDLNGNIAYVGDGLNDAPTLMLADVGISMGINGSDASIEASDIVLVDDDPNKIVSAIKISKYTQKIVWQNIILSAGIKFLFLLLGTLGITGMLSAVFADVGVTLLAICNSMRALIYNPTNK